MQINPSDVLDLMQTIMDSPLSTQVDFFFWT